MDIENIKNILGINGDNFIILLDNVHFLNNKEDEENNKGLIAILLQNNDYEIIEINKWYNTNLNLIIDKSKFRLCRCKYFSVYKIDLKDLDFKMNEIKPAIKPPVKPAVPVTTPVTTPAVKPAVPEINPPVITPVVPVIKPPVKSVTTPVKPEAKPVKNIDPGVSNTGNSNKSNSNNNNLCSCKSEIKITS